MEIQNELNELRKRQVVEEMQHIFATVSNKLVIPLYLSFWIVDYYFFPDYIWKTLALRLLVIPLVFFGRYVLSKPRSYDYLQLTMSVYAILCAAIINVIIFIIPDPTAGYYVGLNLVAFGGLSLIPFSKMYLLITAVGIYGPYYMIEFLRINQHNSTRNIAMNTSFILGTLVICGVVHYFNEQLRRKELKAQGVLQQELRNRAEIIEKKSKEAIELKQLTSQFSPQVIASIQSGQISVLDNLKEQKICAVFVDIVNSTESIAKLPAQKAQIVLEYFLSQTVNTFLKYDLTIDKFLGDGVLAFSNSPVLHADYIDRVCMATLELIQLFQNEQSFFVEHWGKPLQIRGGIAVGYASVGFLGEQKKFRTFTALGRPLNFASRLSSMAKPNSILVDNEVALSLSKKNFQTESIGKQIIRGFNEGAVEVFELQKTNLAVSSQKSPIKVCPNHTDVYLSYDLQGNYFYCKHCSFQEGISEIGNVDIDYSFLKRKI